METVTEKFQNIMWWLPLAATAVLAGIAIVAKSRKRKRAVANVGNTDVCGPCADDEPRVVPRYAGQGRTRRRKLHDDERVEAPTTPDHANYDISFRQELDDGEEIEESHGEESNKWTALII